MKKLTDRQRQIYEFIREKISAHGSSPTIREIGKHMGITSTNGVRLHITALIKKGYLRKQEHIARGLELVQNIAQNASKLPLVGSVPAGMPIDAIENIEGEFVIDSTFMPNGEAFSLRVTGNSMINAGIFDGDIVLVERRAEARKGDIVVAIIGDEATVKRYFPENNRIRLQPENDDFEPIIVDKNSPEFRLAGKVVGLMRKL